MNIKQKVMSGLYWTAGGKFIGQMITWAITVIIIRLLEPADYGLMSLTCVFVGFFTLLSELGLGAAIVQREELSEIILKALFGMIIFLSLLLYLFLFLTAPIISNFYSEPRLVKLIDILALQFIFMGFTVLPQSLLLREMAFKQLAWIDFLSAISGSAITLILAIQGYGVWALVWGTLAIRVVTMVGLNVAKPFFHKPKFITEGIRDFFSFGGYVTLSRILWYCYICADVLIVGKLLGQELLGFYSVGVYLANLPMEKVSGLINQVAFPAFSTIRTDPNSDPSVAGRHFLKAVRVLSCISFPVLWGLSSVAPEIVNVFLGPKWATSSLTVLILALIVPIRMVNNLIDPTVFGLGHPEISFKNSLFALIIMPIAFVIGSYWDLLGVSLAWFLAFLIVFWENMSRLVKILKINLTVVLKAMFKPFLSASIMFGVIHFLRLSRICGDYDILNLMVFTIFGVGIYGGLMWLINRDGLKEIKALFIK